MQGKQAIRKRGEVYENGLVCISLPWFQWKFELDGPGNFSIAALCHSLLERLGKPKVAGKPLQPMIPVLCLQNKRISGQTGIQPTISKFRLVNSIKPLISSACSLPRQNCFNLTTTYNQHLSNYCLILNTVTITPKLHRNDHITPPLNTAMASDLDGFKWRPLFRSQSWTLWEHDSIEEIWEVSVDEFVPM